MKHESLAKERPDLLAQWSSENNISPYDVSCGSHKKVRWVCSKGHNWEAIVKNRALVGSGCPYCEHRAVLKGYNDFETLYPEIAKTWSRRNQLRPFEVSPNSNRRIIWECKKGHEWIARVADRTRGHNCPYCTGCSV